ncbi:MAG: hypothetical protein NZL83_01740 [Candidatus Absconditabacterales bacterium]|nr:hypothetical protein [Candidatus Absconditabacterales bacterium]
MQIAHTPLDTDGQLNVDKNSAHSSQTMAQKILSQIGKKGDARNVPRFQDVRYKVYSFLMFLVFWMVTFGYAGIGGWGEKAWMRVENISTQKQLIMKQIADIADTRARYNADIDFIKLLAGVLQQTDGIPPIVLCLNREQSCDALPAQIQNNLSLVRAFAQLQSLDSPKMLIDEGKILKNINEFLLQRDPLERQVMYNGKMRSLSLGEPERIEGLLYKLPVTIDITFQSKDDVFAFLHNIEKRLHYTQEEGFQTNLIYHIKDFTYDVLNFQSPQDVRVVLEMFYYNSKRLIW